MHALLAHKVLKGLTETSHDERVLVDAYTCGGCFVGNVIYRVAILVTAMDKLLSHSASQVGSGSLQMMVWTNIWMARVGCRSMRVSSLEAASTPVVALSRRWIVATSRAGAVMRAAGASCLVMRDAASAGCAEQDEQQEQ
jgi:hypothetical protein